MKTGYRSRAGSWCQLMPKSVFTSAYASFLTVLIAARKRAGVSQVELARRVGKNQQFISGVEQGVRRLDLIEFCVLARGLGLEPNQLFAEIVAALPADIEI